MKEKKKDNKYGALMILIVTAVLFLTIALTDSPEEILTTIQASNPFWLFLAIGCYVAFWLVDAIALYWLVQKISSKKYYFLESARTAITGTFFSCLTPSSTGGQPMQILRMKKHGISVGQGTAILTIRFIVFQCASALSGIILLIMRYGYFQARVSGFRILVIIGLALSVVAAILLLLASLYPKMAYWSAEGLTRILAKLRIVRNRDKTLEKVRQVVAEFAEWPKLVKDDKCFVAGQVLISCLQMMAYYAIAFFVFKAINAGNADFSLVLTAAACVWLASTFIPLPGGSGGAEGMFVLFFSTIYRDSSVGVALLLWRFVTFYFPIIVGGIMLFFENQKKLKLKPLKIKKNKITMK